MTANRLGYLPEPVRGPGPLYRYLRSSDLHWNAIRKYNDITSLSQILGKRVIKTPGRAMRCSAFVVLRKPVVRTDEIARAVVNISLSSVLTLALKSGLPYVDVLQPGRKLQLTRLNMSSEARKENNFQTRVYSALFYYVCRKLCRVDRNITQLEPATIGSIAKWRKPVQQCFAISPACGGNATVDPWQRVCQCAGLSGGRRRLSAH